MKIKDVTMISCERCGKKVKPARYAEHRWSCPLMCHHCDKRFPTSIYVEHVKGCLQREMDRWDEMAYSAQYLKQVRAMSRFAQPGAKKRRSQFRAWGWWLKTDSPAILGAEIPPGLDLQAHLTGMGRDDDAVSG